MKSKFSISFILISFLSLFGQENINFEQKAFEFYKDSIIDKTSSKINFVIKVQDYNYWESDCTEKYTLKWQDTMFALVESKNNIKVKNINLSNDNRFKKIKKFKKGDYPRTFVISNLKRDENQNFVTIVETYKNEVINYLFEMDIYGKVINWCKGKWIGKN
ncbi:hypothetical protein [Flavobacterium helocola]|jgi:hypothetical protein|uniref:Beta-lactamase-inhibitor-like PepSY-like domain-containing protein n=1 Tax=Flavobacterium helocola TaxID=3139139 RepID=A0ABU9I7C3_9FLAO